MTHELPKDGDLWRVYKRALESGDYSLSTDVAKRGVQVHLEKGDLRHAGIWQRALAAALYYQGRFDDAAASIKAAISSHLDDYERAVSLTTLATIYTHTDRYRSAFATFKRAFELAKSFRCDTYLWTHLYGCRATAFRRVGKTDKAIVDWEGAADLLRGEGYLWRAAYYINNIGFLLTKGGHLEEAEQRLLEALELVEEDPNAYAEAGICDSLGYLYTLKGEEFNAERFLRRSAKILGKLGDKNQLIGTLLHFSEFYECKRQYETAYEYAERAVKLAIEAGSESWIAEARDRFKWIMVAKLEENLGGYFEIHRRNCSIVQRVLDRHRRPGSFGPGSDA